MRSMFLGFCLFLSPVLWGATDSVKEFTQQLSKGQKSLLNEFLLTVTESSAGYVMYGERPMSIETYDLSCLNLLANPNQQIVALMKGKELWEDLNLSNEKDYFLSVFEKDSKCHVVCINRKAFIQNVKENITLFRYVLGPALTAENLLSELVAAKSHVYEVLDNNQVLLEILQGYGKQNALVHARVAIVSDPQKFGAFDEFPLVSKKMFRSWAGSSEKYQRQPSFGFSTIAAEELTLRSLTVDSDKLKPFIGCEIPHFSCEPDSEETKSLLSSYEQNRAKILKATGSKTFLEDSLRKFFAENAQVAVVPAVPKERKLLLPSSKEETALKIVQIVQKKIAMEPTGVKKFQTAFMQGVAAREKGKQMPVQLKRLNDTQGIQKDLLACKNLEQANAYFGKLSSRDQFVTLVPNEVLYKVVKAGKGNAVTAKTKRVSFQYSFQILGTQNEKDYGIVKQERLDALIPGVALALVGMERGEERVVYIHPKYAYGEETFFAPNISIVAQIRLLDSEEGDREVSILPPHQLEVREYKDLLARFEVLRGEEYFDQGVELWDSIKKSGDYIDFQTFQKAFNSYSESKEAISSNTENQFAIDLVYYLLSFQQKD